MPVCANWGSRPRRAEGILTGTRYQEIVGARRSEIDESLRRWTIPADRMKLGRSHVVPLSDAALALYRTLPIDRQCDLLFPSPDGGNCRMPRWARLSIACTRSG